MGGRFKLLKDAGKGSGANVYIMEGQVNNHATRQRHRQRRRAS
jgi:hypothetical protein